MYRFSGEISIREIEYIVLFSRELREIKNALNEVLDQGIFNYRIYSIINSGINY